MKDSISTVRGNCRTEGFTTFADKVMQEHYAVKKEWKVEDAIESLVKEMLDHMEFLDEYYLDSKHNVMHGMIDEIDKEGKFMLGMFDRSIDAIERLIKFGRSFSSVTDSMICQSSSFHRKFAETKKTRESIVKKWPWTPNHSELEAENFDDEISIEEAIDDVQSQLEAETA